MSIQKVNSIVISVLIYTIFFNSCKQEKEQTKIKELCYNFVIEKKIKLEEGLKPIGFIRRALVTEDSLLYILDISSSDVKIYDYNGNLRNILFSKGNGPLNLRTPRTIGLFESNILIGDVGFYAYKLFDREGKTLIKTITINGIRPVGGDTKFIDESTILTSGFWDYEENGETKSGTNPCIIFDTSGNIKKRIGKYPSQYKKLKYLDGSTYLDINRFGDFVITYTQSPDISIGNIYNEKFVDYEYPDLEGKYIIKELENAKPTEEFWNEVNTKIFYNTGVYFINDTIFVRSFSKHTAESVKSGSFVNADNYIEIFTINGKRLKEFKTEGTLIAVQKDTNLLFFESSDLPDNRIISINKIEIQK